ncbi:Protein kinase of the Mitotic Exit Network, partial [Coemansia spiralis]
RTVSSIAAYEEDSGDDWDNAFKNLDTLKLKTKPRPGIAYPQSIAAPTSPPDAARKRSFGASSDPPDADAHPYHQPVPMDRAVSDSTNAHMAAAMQCRPHTSPPSPRMWAVRRHLSPADNANAERLTEYEDEALSNESAYAEPADYAKTSHMPVPAAHYVGASDLRLETMAEAAAKRPVLGLHATPAEAPSPADGISTKPSLGQLAQPRPQQRQQQQQQMPRSRTQEKRELPPGFPSRSSEERLRRETEIRWVQGIGSIVDQLRGATQEDAVASQCQQLVALLREGRGVFSASSEWRVRSVIDALRAHRSSSTAQRHLLVVVNRLCHMDARYSRVFCLHGILPLVLPIMQRAAGDEVQAEAVNFVSRLCRSEDPAPIQMLLACDGITALCAAAGALVELDVAAGAALLSRVATSLLSLIITKGLPPDLHPSDLGDLLTQARAVPLLSQLLAKYGEACLAPPSSGPSSANGSDSGSGGQQPAASATDRVYHGVCDVL